MSVSGPGHTTGWHIFPKFHLQIPRPRKLNIKETWSAAAGGSLNSNTRTINPKSIQKIPLIKFGKPSEDPQKLF
jgi:hypothetical protein